MKLIVGLGNPGKQYQLTRHNLGFLVIDRVCDELKIQLSDKSRFEGLFAQAAHPKHEKIFFLEPQTFMNLSGRSVAACANFYKIDPADILVIHDDLDLAFAKCRFARSGRSAGHNGVESIIDSLGTQDFARLKIGIGRPPFPDQEPSDFVLQNFSKDEQKEVLHLISHMANAVMTYLNEGIQKAMEMFH